MKPYGSCSVLEVESYVYSGIRLEDTPGHASGTHARIERMVLRLETMALEAHDPAYIDRIAAIENDILTLPRLRTVTLETIEADESAELAEKLPRLHAIGKLRRRTCKEAQAIAQEALRPPAAGAKTEGIVSPLWFSDEFDEDDRDRWCVNRSCLLPPLDLY